MESGPYTLGGQAATGMAQYNPKQEKPLRQNPQVIEELEVLEKVVAEAGGAIQALNDRLVGVMTQEPPSTEKDSKVGQSLVTIASNIRSHREGVCFILSRINSILQRLEI